MKILGALYKIPLSNILGDAGYGYFNAAYSIYFVMLTISSAGLPVALSRIISERGGDENQALRSKIFKVSLISFTAIGIVLASFACLLPDTLARVLLTKPESARSIEALAPSILFVCMLSAFRGYIQGHSDMKPTTWSQIIEVLAKVIVGLILAKLILSKTGDVALAAAGAMFGVSAGSLASLIYIIFAYFRRKKSEPPTLNNECNVKSIEIVRLLFKIGIPITLGSCVMSVISLLDTKLINSQLLSSGLSKELSDILYGSYSVMTSLYNLPASFITPLTISLVPAVSEAISLKDYSKAGNIAESSLRIAAVIFLPMCFGLIVMSKPIVAVLYENTYKTGPVILSLLGTASIFICYALILNSILLANGNERIPMYAMLIGGTAKLLLNYRLVGDIRINIYGAPIGTIACYCIMCIVSGLYLKKTMGRHLRFSSVILKPLLSSLIMSVAAFFSYMFINKLMQSQLGSSRITMAISLLFSILIAIAVYLISVILTKSISLADLKLIPKGEKIAQLLKIRD
ncbi:MAG: polysaccharide biosynthesis protein [Clostridiales bacterium]|nr:polysaccharide biosynthesis protein [Clostridiales bacterium]